MIAGMLTSLLLFVSIVSLSNFPKCSKGMQTFSQPRPCVAANSIRPSNLLSCGTIAVNLRLRFKAFQQPSTPNKNKSLTYLIILLLAISSDVETNPGPDYPCGTCGSQVCDTDPAVECDNCGMWFHLQCQGLDSSWYQQLVDCEQSFAWSCTTCGNLNHSNASSILSSPTKNSVSSIPSDETPSIIDHSNKPSKPQSKQQKFISKLKLLSVNCQSIVNKKHEFQQLIHSQNPDIVTATESWLTKDHYTGEFFPPSLSYSIFRRDRTTGKGGGVFIMVKNTLLPSEQPKLNTDCEILWIKLDIKGSKPLHIASYYRPHEYDMKSILELEKSLEMVRNLKGLKLILGDFNFPKLLWDPEHTPSLKPGCSTNAVYDKFLDILDDHGLTQMVSESTRQGNILDLFLTTNPTLADKVEIIPGISDHDIVSTLISARPTFKKQKSRNCYLFRKANWASLKEYVQTSAQEILKLADTLSVEDLWLKLKTTIETGISKYVPSKKIKSKRSLPWITKQIKKLIHKRDVLYQKAKKNRGNNETWRKFKTIKQLIKSKIKTSYNEYLENILDISSSNTIESSFSPKKLFTLLKNSKQDSQNVSPLKDCLTGTLKSNDREKADVLNRQFQSVFSGSSPLSLKQLCMQRLRHLNPKKFCTYPLMSDISVSKVGVLKLLANLKTDKAAGPDQIRPVVLKELRHEIIDIVTVLYQKSLTTGEIPHDWTRAYVCPIYKKGDTSDPANYRPISLTCILCKTLEHIVTSHLSKHLSSHNILYDLQHGFREKRSCETQLIELTDHLVNNVSSGSQTDLILLDFSKAFDKVNHLKLLFSLQEYGVSAQVLNWTRSFLLGRSQAVVLDGESSAEVPVTSGVPQGSVLGPLCFLIYINQLPFTVSKSQVRLFADDTAIYLTVNSLSDCASLQKDLDKLQEWEKQWDMEFNPSKCQVLHITRNKTVIKNRYYLHGQALEPVSQAKYLGVDFSSDLSFNTHVSRITAKANRSLGFIKRNISTRNERVRELAYKSLVRPQLEYASSVWCPYTKTAIQKVENVQRRAVRWVKHNYSPLSSVTAMQDSLGWRSLEHRRYDSKLIMFYKIYHNLVAIPLPQYIQTPIRFTRHMHPLSLRQVQVQSDYQKFSFFPHCIRLWNQLPADVASLPNLDEFRGAVVRMQY